MLNLSKKDGGHINAPDASETYYDDLVDSINQLDWKFMYYFYKDLKLVHFCMGKLRTRKEREAFERKLDLIEITQGDPKNPIQILVEPGLDILSIKKQWCQSWCEAHGYKIEGTNGLGQGQSSFKGLRIIQETAQGSEMLLLHDPLKRFSLQIFEGFDELCGYFNRSKNLTGLEEEQKDAKWEVSYYSKSHLASLCQHKKGGLTDEEKKAYEQGVGMVEVYSGALTPKQFALGEGFHLKPIIEGWCYGYASFKGYALLKVSGPPIDLSTFKRDFPPTGLARPQAYGFEAEPR